MSAAPRGTLARLLCVNVAALIAVIVAWGSTSDARHRLALTVLAVAPLLLPLPGLWRGSRYTAAWASLLTVPYLLFGLVERAANPAARVFAAAELVLAFVLFAGLVIAARGAGRVS